MPMERDTISGYQRLGCGELIKREEQENRK
jgi:hypothetical protein